MSQIPIETNFTGIQKRLVPKCIVVDIYDLQLSHLLLFDTIQIDPSFPQTLCVLAGGSIITNIKIISPLIVTYEGHQIPPEVPYPYVILFQAGTKFDTDITPTFTWEEDQVQFGNLNSILELSYGDFNLIATNLICNNEIYQKLGAPLSVNSQIYIIGLGPTQIDKPTVYYQVPHIQCLIEYLAEEK